MTKRPANKLSDEQILELRSLIGKRGWSTARAARRVGCSTTTANSYTRDLRKVKQSLFKRIPGTVFTDPDVSDIE